MPRQVFKRLLILFLLSLASTGVQAELYKWVDENGKIHYSDKEPAAAIDAKVIADEQEGAKDDAGTSSASTRPIIRPYEKTSRRLHLLDTRYLWKREAEVTRSSKIGVFHTGKGCTSRGAMNTPDVFIHHQRLFPDETKLTYRISKVINGLDYESERTEKYRLLERLQKTGGLSLHAEIVAMEFNTCAPGTRSSELLTPIEQISAHRFTRHRVRLQVNWQLKTNRDQELVYETTTAGSYNGWTQSGSSTDAIGNALESSVLALFTRQEFIDRILVEEDGGDLREIDYAGLKPVSPEEPGRTRKLFVVADGRDWITNQPPETEIGHMLFGENCAAKKPLPLGAALANQKWLVPDARQTSNAIVTGTRPLGYSLSPSSNDTLAQLEDSGGYSLNAKLVKVIYDACAPSLSASTRYKPLDTIPFRRLTRNRVQVWIEWTLKSGRNRQLLYRTKTMGFAGSLLADTRGSDAMSEALGMAAEQLFADRDFIELIIVKTRELPIEQPFAAKHSNSARGIVRSPEQRAMNLFLVVDDNPWSRIPAGKTIGFYAYGADCTAYEERRWPQALNDHPRLFADSGEIAEAEAKVVKSLGYPYQVAKPYNVVNLKRKLGGLSLHADIVDLRFDSCAPEMTRQTVLSKRKLSSSQFSRHRVIARINWKLVGGEYDEVLFQGMTEGVADSWLLNSRGRKIFGMAIENAITQLFARPEFVASLVLDRPGDKGILDKLFSFLEADDGNRTGAVGGLANKFVIQAHAAQVFSEINVLKVGMLQHFMMEGDWPDNLSAIGYSEAMFNNSDTISHVNLQPDGSMVVELKELFGADKIITLRPDIDDGNVGMNRWYCSSNLDSAYLPQNCDGL